MTEAITVPVDAVVGTGIKQAVKRGLGNGYFEPCPETSWRLGDRAAIAGLIKVSDII